MKKELFLIILIFYSCDLFNPDEKCISDTYLTISAPDLTIDNNGYYHMIFLNDYVQTFTTLEAQTGILDYNQKVTWVSNKEILIAGHWTNLVNGSSYTDNDDGKAYTVLSVWENFIGDTIKVYCGYTDNCGINFGDSLEVVVE